MAACSCFLTLATSPQSSHALFPRDPTDFPGDQETWGASGANISSYAYGFLNGEWAAKLHLFYLGEGQRYVDWDLPEFTFSLTYNDAGGLSGSYSSPDGSSSRITSHRIEGRSLEYIFTNNSDATLVARYNATLQNETFYNGTVTFNQVSGSFSARKLDS